MRIYAKKVSEVVFACTIEQKVLSLQHKSVDCYKNIPKIACILNERLIFKN
jgi:hypothetical protein